MKAIATFGQRNGADVGVNKMPTKPENETGINQTYLLLMKLNPQLFNFQSFQVKATFPKLGLGKN